MLKLNNVRFSYSSEAPKYVFELEVGPGEIVGVAGKSGSGKSTLLDLIAGFQSANEGTITLENADITALRPEDRPVSILFQNNNTFGHLSAMQNVLLGGSDEEKATNALDEVGLADFADQKCSLLSGGQQQRVALARTLTRNQPILLLDEPFSALDSETAEHMRQLVKSLVLKNKWHTILVSHHEQDFAALTDRKLVLEDTQLKI